jgi:hypothetical protein
MLQDLKIKLVIKKINIVNDVKHKRCKIKMITYQHYSKKGTGTGTNLIFKAKNHLLKSQ